MVVYRSGQLRPDETIVRESLLREETAEDRKAKEDAERKAQDEFKAKLAAMQAAPVGSIAAGGGGGGGGGGASKKDAKKPAKGDEGKKADAAEEVRKTGEFEKGRQVGKGEIKRSDSTEKAVGRKKGKERAAKAKKKRGGGPDRFKRDKEGKFA